MSLQTIRTARIKEDDGTITDNVPLGAFGIHIKMANGKNLEDTLKEYVHKNMDVGKGLIYETWEEESLVPTQAPDLIRAYIGQGLCYDSRDTKVNKTHFMVNLSDGLKFKDNTENSKITLRTGQGLHFVGDKADEHTLEAYLAQGLKFDGLGAIMANLGNGLEFSGNAIGVKLDSATNKALSLGAGGLKLSVDSTVQENSYPVSGAAVKSYCKDYAVNITSDDQSVDIKKKADGKGISFDLSVQGGGPGPGPETGVSSVTGIYPIQVTPKTGDVKVGVADDTRGLATVVQDVWKSITLDRTGTTAAGLPYLYGSWGPDNAPIKHDNTGDTYYIDCVEVTNAGNSGKNGIMWWTIDTSGAVDDVIVYSLDMGDTSTIRSAMCHFWTFRYDSKKPPIPS